MARVTDRFIQDGDVVDFASAPYALTPADGVLIGAQFGVSLDTSAISTPGRMAVEGVWDLPKTAAQAPTQGQLAYWDNAARSVTTVSTGNTRIGSFTRAALAGDALCRVRLSGTPAPTGA